MNDKSHEIKPLLEFKYDKPPRGEWRFTPTGNFHDFSIIGCRAPNWFHRLMQRWLLGFRYERMPKV